MTKKITIKAFLVTSMLAITVLMFSCANDKTFEGTWKRAETVNTGGATDVFITFKSDKKMDFKMVLISTGQEMEEKDAAEWSANYTEKKLTLDWKGGKNECKFEFAKNFKELTLSSCSDSKSGKEMLENTWKKQ